MKIIKEMVKQKVDDGSIDLVITSPPYLNSRDYTYVNTFYYDMCGNMNDTSGVPMIGTAAMAAILLREAEDGNRTKNFGVN